MPSRHPIRFHLFQPRLFDQFATRTSAAAGHATTFALAFRPDGQEIGAAGLDGVVRIFHAADGKLIRQFVPVKVSATAESRPKGAKTSKSTKAL